jgi:hypothetical protein
MFCLYVGIDGLCARQSICDQTKIAKKIAAPRTAMMGF